MVNTGGNERSRSAAGFADRDMLTSNHPGGRHLDGENETERAARVRNETDGWEGARQRDAVAKSFFTPACARTTSGAR